MLNVIIKAVFFVVKALADLFVTPIQKVIVLALPDIGDLILNCESWLSTYGFRYLKFAKMFFMRLLCFPQALFTLIIGYIIIKIGLHVSIQLYRFGINIYNKFKI